jgi:glycosyltransferase involved in cell wall biosynthesis
MNIVAVAHVSPHLVTDGYTLRVKRMLESLRGVPGIDRLSLIVPVPVPESGAAREWADAAGISLVDFAPPSLNPFLPVSRARVTAAVAEYFATRRMEAGTVALALGIPTGFDVARQALGVPLVVDIMDEIAVHLRQRLKDALRGLRLRRALSIVDDTLEYRRNVTRLKACAAVVACSPDDVERLRRMGANAQLHPVLNGVDVPAQAADLAAPVRFAMFHGVLDYPPNFDAAMFICGDIAPRLAGKLPALQIKIVGRRLGAALRERVAATANVSVLEDVPSVTEHLLAAQVGLYPLFVRSGIQNKILEAWAAGLPVVTTPGIVNSLSGFAPDVASAVLVGSEAHEFAAHVVRLADDPALRGRLGDAGRQLVHSVFRWEAAAASLARICANAAGTACISHVPAKA